MADLALLKDSTAGEHVPACCSGSLRGGPLMLTFTHSLRLAFATSAGICRAQELGHYLTAAQKKVRLGIPFLIPNITIGSFGAITQVHTLASTLVYLVPCTLV